LSGIDSQSVLVRAVMGIALDGKIASSETARLEERKASLTVTKRTRIFWNQLSVEIRSAGGELALDDLREAVELGLIDLTWMDLCPLLAKQRLDPSFAPMRAEVAARAAAVLAQLSGADATVAA
jgi:hypothetical protein